MCDVSFVQRQSLLRHIRDKHDGKWTCSTCSATFDRPDNYKYHERACQWRASGVKRSAVQVGGGTAKRARGEDVRAPIADEPIVRFVAQTLDGVLQDYSIDLDRREQTVDNIFEVLSEAFVAFHDTIISQLQRKHALKIVYTLHLNFHQSTDPTFITEPPIVLNTEPVEILASTDITETVGSVYDMLINAVDEFEMRGSGWVLDQLLRLDLHVHEVVPLRASTHLSLPKEIRDKHAIVNIQNSDNLCFLWCVIASIYGAPNVRNPQRVSHYRQWANAFNTEVSKCRWRSRTSQNSSL